MKNAVVSQILSTKDYTQFKFVEGNRVINKRNYAKLFNSMKDEQLIIPILVNERMEIIDGQHRFTVAQELGLPVYYYIVNGYNLNQVKIANLVGSTWKKEDFLNMHKEKGLKSYIEFNKIMEKFKINIGDLLKVYAKIQEKRVTVMGKEFESGDLTSEGRDEILDVLYSLEDFSFFEGYKTQQFVGAFVRLYFNEDYDHKRMKDRLEIRRDALKKKSTIDEYLQTMTKDIYSFGAIKKALFYDVETKRFYTI